jgi:hypothetical protein
MTVKDTALDLVKTKQFLDTDQTIHAQWNHHLYTQPDIYGYYSGNSAANNYYVTSTSSATISVNSNTFTSASSITGLSTLNLENAVRVTFDAKITAFPSSFDDIYTDYLIKITPYYAGNAQSQYIDVKTVKLVDNVYNKFEIIFTGNSESSTKFDRIDISIKACATITSGTASVAFKNFSVAKVSSDEILELQVDRLSEIFTPHRPGDQLLENDLLSTTSPYNIISQYYITMDGFIDGPKNDINLIPTALSPFNEFKYFITPRSGDSLTTASFNIFSVYNTSVKTNEIYIKTQNIDMPNMYDGKITNVTVYVKESGTWNTAATISTASVIQNGSFILRWNGSASAWTTGSITYPQIDSVSGTLSTSNYKNIEGIRVLFNLSGAIYSDDTDKYLRVRVIEISPRLKLDLSNFMVSGNVKLSIDEGNLPVPVGMSSTNDGNIVLENLPRYVIGNSGSVFQVFNNNSNSPLSGLIMPEVKFTIYSNIYDTVSPSSSAQVKLATMYANNWSMDGIETVSIPLSDYGKQLQTMNAPDLLLMSSETPHQIGDWKKIVECLLQAGGFSDYDRTSLQQVSDGISIKRYGTNNIFFSSNEKTLWAALSEIFLSWQISFSFDNNGILQFKDLLRESVSTTYSNSSYGLSGYFQLTDTASNSFIPNISTITQDFKEPIGTITTTYRNLSYSAANTVKNAYENVDGGQKVLSNYSQTPWKPNDKRALDCAYIEYPIAIDDNKIKAGTALWNAGASANTLQRKIYNFSGYGIIENEIIYWGGKEYAFTPYLAGYSVNETITSNEDLLNKVANRIGSDNAVAITAASGNASVGTVTITAYNTYAVGDTIYISVPDTFNKFVTLTATTSATFTFKDTAVSNYNISCAGVASKSVSHISYYPTGYLMNVQRGLFGTNAAAHQYKNTFSDSSVFKGVGHSMTLGQSVDTNSSGVPLIVSPKNGINYLGFYQKDSELYNHYQVSIKPKDNLGSVGIFIGADPTSSGGAVSFTYGVAANFATGMFIEFNTKKGAKNPGHIRYGAIANSNKVAYMIKDYMIEDTYINTKGVPKRDPKTKKIIKSRGHVVWLTPPQKKPSTNYVIDLYVDIKTKTITIKVNGKIVQFKNLANNKFTDKIVAPGLVRAGRTFGLFSRNNVADTTIYINSLEAVCNGQHIGGDEDGFNTLEPKNSLDYLLSPYGTPAAVQRPFSFKTKPLLRGISIYDVKFNGDIPYYHYEITEPSGLVGFYNANPDDFQISTLIGTPFRTKIAVRNRSNTVLFPVIESGEANSLGIAGKAIVVQADQKFTTKVSTMPGLQNIEINAPWCTSQNVAETINSDISKNLYAMNQLYAIETFGNPGLEPGDYVYMTYSLKNISASFVLSSVEHSFGEGGMATNLKLRSLHI